MALISVTAADGGAAMTMTATELRALGFVAKDGMNGAVELQLKVPPSANRWRMNAAS